MQLPAEVWRNILHSLPRGYLDDLVVLNRTSHALIQAISEPGTDGPLRPLRLNVYSRTNAKLHIYAAAPNLDHDNTVLQGDEITLRCSSPSKLFRVMRDSIVRDIQ